MHILSELRSGNFNFANRIVLAPMTRARSGKDRIPNSLMAEYYRQRSSAGLLITEATTISPQANGWNESPGIYSNDMVEGWKLVTEEVHKNNAPMFVQLWHCGRASHPDFHNGASHVAPSAIKIQGDYIHTPLGKKPHETPRALESSEVWEVIEDYRLAAINAKEAGFDGVEIHAANGYLLDTFLQSRTNSRTDDFGGSVEKRYRILSEIIDAVSSVLSPDRIGVRISPNGVFNDMGSADFREQFIYVASQLDKIGIAYLHVMDGLGFGFHGLGEPMKLEEFRAVFKGVVIGNVGYDKETAEATIARGNADMIAFGRPFISNPDLVERFRNNWPLNPEADVADWYRDDGVRGYTDFPRFST